MRKSKGYRTSDLISRAQNCRRRVFTVSEDKTIIKFVSSSKFNNNWDALTKLLPWRSARQCRDRWTYYLSPSNNLAPFSPEEDQLIVQKVNELGNKWAVISKYFTGRSDNSIKNRWYSKLKSKCEVNGDGVFSLDPSKIIDAPPRARGRSSKQNQQNNNVVSKAENTSPEENMGKFQNDGCNQITQEVKNLPSLSSSPPEQVASIEMPSKAFPDYFGVESKINQTLELKICKNNCLPISNEPKNLLKQDSLISNDLNFWDGDLIEWPQDIFNFTPNTEFGFF